LQAEIVAVESLTKRASMLKRFIKIAEHLMALNNFNSLFAMYCGLGGNPIHRLKKTWAELPAKTVAKWEEIKALFKIDKNSANFREVLRKAVCPAIPYLGLFLGDLTFMEDGNPSMGGPRGDLVNVSVRFGTLSLSHSVHFKGFQFYFFGFFGFLCRNVD
jgi:son of sevenless-like protein